MPDHSRAYRLDTDRVQSLVGMVIDPDIQRKTLSDLGFSLEGDMAHVPSWRPDILGEADPKRWRALRRSANFRANRFDAAQRACQNKFSHPRKSVNRLRAVLLRRLGIMNV